MRYHAVCAVLRMLVRRGSAHMNRNLHRIRAGFHDMFAHHAYRQLFGFLYVGFEPRCVELTVARSTTDTNPFTQHEVIRVHYHW
jgi:hypothetical protein